MIVFVLRALRKNLFLCNKLASRSWRDKARRTLLSRAHSAPDDVAQELAQVLNAYTRPEYSLERKRCRYFSVRPSVLT